MSLFGMVSQNGVLTAAIRAELLELEDDCTVGSGSCIEGAPRYLVECLWALGAVKLVTWLRIHRSWWYILLRPSVLYFLRHSSSQASVIIVRRRQLRLPVSISV
ncbi:hypothetical protein CRG98_007760 [Punica granatum]|uniref:Uncharacterized protein n=1 Tax=Punica granatum TaxID=22663 RepID=A0A2I0KTP0_PUNGR|nr:hypothetical protein CRG98_007760 [Punica granatum]